MKSPVSNYLFDSNVLIYVLNNQHPYVQALIERTPVELRGISIITWMEVMAGARFEDQIETRKFLNSFRVIELTSPVSERAVALRREMRIKLPTAIVYGTALVAGKTLVTYNTRDFPPGMASVYIPAE